MNENYSTLEHEEWNVDDGFMVRNTVEREFIDGNHEHGPYYKIFHRKYVDGEMVAEQVEYENLEYSFEYYMDKMLCRPKPKVEDFIGVDEMKL